MGSAARRRGTYGEEYLQAELGLRARGRRKEAKGASQTRATGYRNNDGERSKLAPEPALSVSYL
jgi:hypothetical protein